MEMIRLVATMVSPQTEEENAQVRKDMEALGKILPLTEESVAMMEGVRNEVSEKLKMKSEKFTTARKEKERMMREIEREMKLRAIHNS